MCLNIKRVAKTRPLRSRVDFLRARTRDRMRRPYMKPLYWKWMWSMMSRPGDRRIERAAARAARLVFIGEVSTYK